MKKLILLLVGVIFYVQGTYAAYTQADLKMFYDTLYRKIEIKVSYDEDKIINTLEKIDTILQHKLTQTVNVSKKNLFSTLINLNQKQLNKLLGIDESETILLNSSQTLPSYLSSLLDAGYKYIPVSDNLEFYEGNNIYRLSFSSYYELSATNISVIIKKISGEGIIVYYKGKYIFIQNFEKQKKYNFQDLGSKFTHTTTSKNPFFEKDGAYYSYKYTSYIYFDNLTGLYETDLIGNKIDFSKTLYIQNDGKYMFSNDYKLIRLVESNILEGVANKEEFLENLLDDNKFFTGNYDTILNDIKTTTQNLTQGFTTSEEKIRKIYEFVTQNVTYYVNYSNGNKEIFSGVLTYTNKQGVCDGYVKLFLYMLSFAGIDDVEIKRGFAFDNDDFPNFGHAWVRIGEKYYDPTFDDPIGGNGATQWDYFGIPQALMYVNRFDGVDIPQNLKTASLEERKTLVLKNMYDLYEKYSKYSLMIKIHNRVALGYKYNESITISTLSEKKGVFEVKNGMFEMNEQTMKIKSLNYYPVTNANIEHIFSNLDVDISEVYFFKWYNNDGSSEYRLAYDVIF